MIKNEKPKVLNIFLWLASIFSMLGIMEFSSRFIPEENNFTLLIEFIIITVVTLFFLYLISGKKTFSFLNKQTVSTIKMLAPTLIFPAVFFFMGIITIVSDKPPFEENWLINTALLIVNMFLVGIYEESCFRACACDALLPAFRKLRHPFLLTAVISSLVFGYVHVVSVDFSDLQQVLQFVLKISTVALSGATYMIVYWKTRNLTGLAIVHCINDLLPYIIDEIFVLNYDMDGSYTSGDSGTTVVYMIQLVFNIWCLIHIYRKVGKTIDYQKTLEEW